MATLDLVLNAFYLVELRAGHVIYVCAGLGFLCGPSSVAQAAELIGLEDAFAELSVDV